MSTRANIRNRCERRLRKQFLLFVTFANGLFLIQQYTILPESLLYFRARNTQGTTLCIDGNLYVFLDHAFRSLSALLQAVQKVRKHSSTPLVLWRILTFRAGEQLGNVRVKNILNAPPTADTSLVTLPDAIRNSKGRFPGIPQP